MRDFLNAGKLLLFDLASTILFVAVFLLTHNTFLSTGLGMTLGLAQIGVQRIRRKPIDMMEWLSLFLVIAAGTATLLTDDPRYVLFKPSVIYVIVGVVMLKPGWMNRYLPEIARSVVPDVAAVVGFLWAGLMFASAVVNAFVALTFSVATWALVMPILALCAAARSSALRMSGRRRTRSAGIPMATSDGGTGMVCGPTSRAASDSGVMPSRTRNAASPCSICAVSAGIVDSV